MSTLGKIKYVLLSEEKEFIRLDNLVKKYDSELSKLKEKLRKQFDRGFIFQLLTPKPSEGRFAPPWKDIAHELAEKYMSKSEYKKWDANLIKQYPPTDVATSFIVPKDN